LQPACCADCIFQEFHGEEGPVVAANAKSKVTFERCMFLHCSSSQAGLLLIVQGAHSDVLLQECTFQLNSGNQLSMPHPADGTFAADQPYRVWLQAGSANGTAIIANARVQEQFPSAQDSTYLDLRKVRLLQLAAVQVVSVPAQLARRA
jgi:hypothetical protein